MTEVGVFAEWVANYLKDLKVDAKLRGYSADDVLALAITHISAKAIDYEVKSLGADYMSRANDEAFKLASELNKRL